MYAILDITDKVIVDSTVYGLAAARAKIARLRLQYPNVVYKIVYLMIEGE